jgi:argininosuccinate lyase
VTLWAARVESELAPEVEAFLRADDAELLPYDCRATAVHARRLHEAGILSAAELAEAETALERIAEEGVSSGEEDEDVHSAIERLLGPVGRAVHAGRSRNDQVAAAFRLYVADACAEARAGIVVLAGAILDRAAEEADTLFPGYTHLQRAQPVTFGHHLLAWMEMLERDLVRFAHAAEQARPSPLGAGALAGSTLPVPGPPGPQARNSVDAVADRDFALDYLYACAVLLGHLSRIGEEIVLWCTAEFGFVHLSEGSAAGSSAMPQKLNPDVAELVRGKAGTALGRLTGLLAVVKGIPLAYDRDLQEDKAPVFAARRDVEGALKALAVVVAELEVDRERALQAASDPGLLATDAAEALVAAGTPFRDGYEQIAEAVREGGLEPPSDAAASVAARGAPGPGGVHEALAAARERLAAAETAI